MADPDIEVRGIRLDPEKNGGYCQTIFFSLQASLKSKNKGLLGASPRSATAQRKYPRDVLDSILVNSCWGAAEDLVL